MQKSEVVDFVVKKKLSTLLLSRVVNPFCEINVAKYAL
jgi:hypothetical protein